MGLEEWGCLACGTWLVVCVQYVVEWVCGWLAGCVSGIGRHMGPDMVGMVVCGQTWSGGSIRR